MGWILNEPIMHTHTHTHTRTRTHLHTHAPAYVLIRFSSLSVHIHLPFLISTTPLWRRFKCCHGTVVYTKYIQKVYEAAFHLHSGYGQCAHPVYHPSVRSLTQTWTTINYSCVHCRLFCTKSKSAQSLISNRRMIVLQTTVSMTKTTN